MRIGFIGAGKMAQALARGIIASETIAPDRIMASCPSRDQHFAKEMSSLGVAVTHTNTELADKNDVVFLAVKPQIVKKVAAEIAPHVTRNKLIVSIAMGINIRTIESLLPNKARIVRVMPNTPSVVRAGAAGYSMGGACLEGDSETVKDLLSCVGYAVELPEQLLDPITGLSGSGPAYMFCIMEGMADAGVKLGIPRDLASKLAAHTLLGAAKMVLETGIHPAQLKDDVQSPAGSSIYGMHVLERAGLRGIIMDGIVAAADRSRETGSGAQSNYDTRFD